MAIPKKTFIFVLSCALLTAIVLTIITLLNRNNIIQTSSHTIVLTEQGYFPSTIIVSKGDIIIFETTLNNPFWPASDTHPTHGVYPEFDALEPISSNETWSFKFTKAGVWSFHDHLAPYNTGEITVVK